MNVSNMLRWVRLLWVICTNFWFALVFIDYFFFSMWHYDHWYTIFQARQFWTLLGFLAVLGIFLDAFKVKFAREVNIGLWLLFAVYITLGYFSLWGGFTEDSWMAFIFVPFSVGIAITDFLLYRPRLVPST